MKEGLLTKVTKNGTIRMCPPLNIKTNEIQEALDIENKLLNVINFFIIYR